MPLMAKGVSYSHHKEGSSQHIGHVISPNGGGIKDIPCHYLKYECSDQGNNKPGRNYTYPITQAIYDFCKALQSYQSPAEKINAVPVSIYYRSKARYAKSTSDGCRATAGDPTPITLMFYSGQ